MSTTVIGADRKAGASGPVILAVSLIIAAASCVPAVGAEQGAPNAANNPPTQMARQAAVCDAECIRGNTDRAVAACTPVIEAQAPIDFDWLHRPLPGIFEEAEQPTATSSVARYRGDLIRFQTPQMEWVRMSYECGYDLGAKKVVFINMHPGRLNLAKPNVSASVTLPSTPAVQRLAGSVQPVPQLGGATTALQAAMAPKKPPRVGEPNPITIEQQTPRVRP